MKSLLFSMLIFPILTACLSDQGDGGTTATEEDPFYYKRIEDGKPVTGNENLILRCSNAIAGGFCESICISEVRPEFKRFTLAMSNYEANGKCFIYIFGFNPQNGDLPEVRYYSGDYATKIVSGVTKGFCNNISIVSPNFQGFWQFTDNTSNEYLTLFDSNKDIILSHQLSVNQGDVFTYYDSDFNDDITIQTRQGYECRKSEEITDALIDDLAI